MIVGPPTLPQRPAHCPRLIASHRSMFGAGYGPPPMLSSHADESL